MKTAHLPLAILSIVLLTTQATLAYYCPSAGHWPNRDPLGEDGGLNLYGLVDNNPITQYDFLGLELLFENESCQAFNANDPYSPTGGTDNKGGTVPPTWRQGGSGSFDHSGWNTGQAPGICNTDTHILIRAKNTSRCCQTYRVTCAWRYTGSATGHRRGAVFVEVTFLGDNIARLFDMKYGGSVNTAQGAGSGASAKVVTVPFGQTITVAQMMPKNNAAGQPTLIEESGYIICTAECLDFNEAEDFGEVGY